MVGAKFIHQRSIRKLLVNTLGLQCLCATPTASRALGLCHVPPSVHLASVLCGNEGVDVGHIS